MLKVKVWEEKGTTEDEMVGWHHWLSGHEFEKTPLVCDGQGDLLCSSPWGHQESDTTEQLNRTETVPCESWWNHHRSLDPGSGDNKCWSSFLLLLVIFFEFSSDKHCPLREVTVFSLRAPVRTTLKSQEIFPLQLSNGLLKLTRKKLLWICFLPVTLFSHEVSDMPLFPFPFQV